MCLEEECFEGEVDEEFICAIGGGVFEHPLMTPCQHEFCMECIQKSLRHKSVCSRPLCHISAPRCAGCCFCGRK
jgi:hypothetical protein